MKTIQLVQLDPSIESSLMENTGYLQAMMEEDWARVAELVHKVVGKTLPAIPKNVDELHWGGYLVVDAETREVVGSAAYKGEPNQGGSVEIAYFTYSGFEGQGYATQVAKRLIQLAGSSTTVNQVVAHTLPEANASTRVLEKAGMSFAGEVNDPDDGQVWQWRTEV